MLLHSGDLEPCLQILDLVEIAMKSFVEEATGLKVELNFKFKTFWSMNRIKKNKKRRRRMFKLD
jgi:hypothetical protein